MIPFELIKSDRQKYLSSIFSFMGVSDHIEFQETSNKVVNRSISGLSQDALRISNHFTTSYFNRQGMIPSRLWNTTKTRQIFRNLAKTAILPRVKKKELLPEPYLSTFKSFYAKSNNRLIQLTGLELQDFSYPL